MSWEDECDQDCISKIIQFWTEGILIPTIAVFGILGNIFCLFVLSNKSVELKPSFANLLKCLSVYDTALLVREIFIIFSSQKSDGGSRVKTWSETLFCAIFWSFYYDSWNDWLESRKWGGGDKKMQQRSIQVHGIWNYHWQIKINWWIVSVI